LYAIVDVVDFEKLHQQFDSEKKFPSAENKSIAEDKDGKFWMASQGLGLFSYDPATKELLNFRKSTKNEVDDHSPPSDVLHHVMVDRDNNIWFTTVNKGIGQLKKQSLIFNNYLQKWTLDYCLYRRQFGKSQVRAFKDEAFT
jgi:ligand-binding sensor domain-containing protein